MTTRQPPPPTARAWVDIDLDALRRNATRLAGHAGTRLMPMLKADGYGLGAMEVARALVPLDPVGFGVATVSEGIALRDGGVSHPILVCPPAMPDEYPAAAASGLTMALGSAREIDAWRTAGGGAWHLGIDTGMIRAGVRWDEIGTLLPAIAAAPPAGAFTHFHSAEQGEASMAVQEARFEHALAALPSRPAVLHTENSAAAARRAPSRWAFIRPGGFLYGAGSGSGALILPEPVVALRARVTAVHRVDAGESVSYDATWVASAPRRIATVALGYADGYRRAFSNRAQMLVRGRRAPIAGRVTMDMIMLDVTHIACDVGDVVTALGTDGDETIRIEEMAAIADCSAYEILSALKLRVVRRHFGAASV